MVEELLKLKHHRLQWKDNVLKQPVFLTRGQSYNTPNKFRADPVLHFQVHVDIHWSQDHTQQQASESTSQNFASLLAF
jgi:hypothetical protein